MKVYIGNDKQDMAAHAAKMAGDKVREAIRLRGEARIIVAKSIVCTCPDTRKAEAVKGALEGPVTNMLPSSFLQLHPDCGMFLDKSSAALLKK